MTVGQVIAKLGLDDKPFEKGLKKAETQGNKAGLKIGALFKNAFSVTLGMGMFEALKKGFQATVSTAIDFNSMLQTAQIGFATMLGSAEKAQKFLEDMADFAVRTPFEYPELLEAAKRMLAYGFAAEEVLPTLRAVGDASAALGSGSVGIDRITLALGQIRAKGKLSAEEMRQLTEAGVPAWHILAEAMGKTVPELQDMVSKGLIPGGKAVEMLTKGMTKRFGGMMASMENTWQGVTSSIKDIWRMTVGALTQNLFGGLNAMLIKVRDFLQQFYTMVQGVMGKKAQQTTDGLVQSTENQAVAMTDVGEATEEATKQAKKNLQSFDEVHQLQEDMADTADETMFATLESGPVTPFEIEDTGQTESMTKMQETLEKLKTLFGPAIAGFKELEAAAKPIVKSVGDGIKWLFNEVLVPFGKWSISDAIPSFLKLLASTLKLLTPVIEGFISYAKSFFKDFLNPVASWTGGKFTEALSAIGSGMEEMTGKVKDFLSGNLLTYAEQTITTLRNVFSGLLDSILNVVSGVIKAITPIFNALITDGLPLLYDLWTGAVQIFEGLFNSVKTIFDGIFNDVIQPVMELISHIIVDVLSSIKTFWDNWGGGIVEGILTTFNTITDLLTSWWNNLLKPIWDRIVSTVKQLWDNHLKGLVDELMNFIGKLVTGAMEIYNKFIAPIVKWFAENLGPPIANAFQFIVDVIGTVIGVIVDILKGFIKILGGLIDFIVGVFTGDWGRAWEGIKTMFEGVWNNIVAVFKGAINIIISAANYLIRGLNKISIKVPNWVADILGIPKGSTFGFNIPEIQKLATGTNYVPQDMLAYLHEGEAVVPKKYNPAAAGLTAETIEQAVYRAFINAMRIMQASAKQDDRELVLKIDNTTLARMQLPAIIREGQRQGLNLVVQGV